MNNQEQIELIDKIKRSVARRYGFKPTEIVGTFKGSPHSDKKEARDLSMVIAKEIIGVKLGVKMLICEAHKVSPHVFKYSHQYIVGRLSRSKEMNKAAKKILVKYGSYDK